MIIGFTEAQMMKRERLIQKAGDSLTDFFGLPSVKIVGILAPTRTFLDEVHLMNSVAFNDTTVKESLFITQNELEALKIFYYYDETHIPSKLSYIINPKKTRYELNDKSYKALYIGYDEAQMMIAEKLFTKQFDTIDNLFGNDVLIAGLPKKTYTLLDMMHFLPKK